MPQNQQISQEEKLNKFKEQEQQNQIKTFIRSYQLKQKALTELVNIYTKNALSPHFANTFKAAVAMLTLPALTNIFYTIRPFSTLAGIMPFAVPLVCLGNYMYFINKDFEAFCLTKQPDAQKARQQYSIICQFSYFSKKREQLIEKLENFRKDPMNQIVDEQK